MAGEIPAFGWGAVGPVEDPETIRQSLFDRALPFAETFGLSAQSGVLQSLGLGTITREAQLPMAAPTQPGVVANDRLLPSTGQMERRLPQTYFDANAQSGIREETPDELAARRDAAGALSQEAYKASPFFRPDVPWSPAMTEDRARVQSEFRDAQRAREFFQEKRPITSFFGSLAGGALDPTNYIPVAGPAVRAAAVARAGHVIGTAAVMAGEAAISQGVLGAVTASAREQFGDDVSWQAQVTDIAMGALTGGLVGGVAGKFAGRAALRAERLENQMKARAVLDDAVRGVAEDGKIKLNPTSAGFVDDVTRDASFGRLQDEVQTASVPERRPEPRAASAPDAAPQHMTTFAAPDGVVVKDGGRFGPVAEGFSGRWDEARAWLQRSEGEAVAALDHPDVGTIDVPWGAYDPKTGSGFGLAKIAAKHPDVVADLPAIIRTMPIESSSPNRAVLASPDHRAVVRLDFDGEAKTWLLTAYAKEDRSRHVRGTTERPVGLQADTSSALPAPSDISSPRPEIDPARVQQAAKAEASVAKPGSVQAFAKDVGFDPQTGESAATGLVRQIEAEGRLTAEDTAALKVADDGIADADAFAKALEVATGCVL